MPKSRRVSKSKTKSLWAKIAALFAVLFLIIWVIGTPQGSNVLGASTTNLFNLGSKTSNSSPSASNCKPMLSAITLSSPCMGKNGQPGFKSVSYKCADGKTGSSTKDCLSPQQALENAGKTCSKGSACKPPSVSGQPKQGGMMQGGQKTQGQESENSNNSQTP